jgi:hypothetical protein
MITTLEQLCIILKLSKCPHPFGESELLTRHNPMRKIFFFKFRKFYIGLSNENAPDGVAQDSYRFSIGFNHCHLSSSWVEHAFERPNGAIKPEANGIGDVVGCGLMLSSQNEVSIFFTGNGILMGQFLLCCWKFGFLQFF